MGIRALSYRFGRSHAVSLAADLLRQAEQLAKHERRRPRQASLRRAISTAYYALFHLLIDDATNRLLPGNERTQLRYCLARAFSHVDMKNAAQGFAQNNLSPRVAAGLNGLPLPPALTLVASVFIDLQQARHEADYNTSRSFTRQEALDLIEQVREAFSRWRQIRKTLQADTFLVALLAQRHMRA